MSAGLAGQIVTVVVITATLLYCLWRGYQAEHPKGPRGGETWNWDAVDWTDPPPHEKLPAGSSQTGSR